MLRIFAKYIFDTIHLMFLAPCIYDETGGGGERFSTERGAYLKLEAPEGDLLERKLTREGNLLERKGLLERGVY